MGDGWERRAALKQIQLLIRRMSDAGLVGRFQSKSNVCDLSFSLASLSTFMGISCSCLICHTLVFISSETDNKLQSIFTIPSASLVADYMATLIPGAIDITAHLQTGKTLTLAESDEHVQLRECLLELQRRLPLLEMQLIRVPDLFTVTA